MGDYFDMNNLISLILLIIPFTAWLLGVLTRFKDGHYLAGIIRLVGGFNIIWIGDILFTLLNGCNVKVMRLISC